MKIDKIKVFIMLTLFEVLTISCSKEDIDPTQIKDSDGNIYNTKIIGTQTWMIENLRTTTYNDGTLIRNLVSNNEWRYDREGGYCNYKNTNNSDTIKNYGRLYNWNALNTGKLCPIGWHIPTIKEWSTLTSFLGGTSVAAGKLKISQYWQSPNIGATNESGFTALPGGGRDEFGYFYGMGNVGIWWSSTNPGVDWISGIILDYRYGSTGDIGTPSSRGYSVRCIKD